MKLALVEQPADDFLLQSSSLYRRSRSLYLAGGGKYRATLLSSPRSLGSADLLKNEIEYSPLATELNWSQSDRIQRKDLQHFESVQQWTTAVYHEQNHRVLWKFLQSRGWHCPTTLSATHRYLNFTESLVIALDLAIADELTARQSERLFSQRVIYHRGSAFMRRTMRNKKKYRELLLLCLHGFYLRLEGLHPDDLLPVLREVWSQTYTAPSIQCAVDRVLALEPRFVDLTNPIWQERHARQVMKVLGSKQGLHLPNRNPHQVSELFLVANAWLSHYHL